MAVLGNLPSWLGVDAVRDIAAGLAVAAIVGVMVVVFFVHSVAARIVAIVVLGAALFGLLRYRSELDHCDRNGCTCTLFGHDLKGGGCAPSR